MALGVRWLIQDYLQVHGLGTVTITFTTDRPVHAWLRWTKEAPDMHLLSATVRGWTSMKDPYYCFDVYQDIEQDEPGDTLQHTFQWPDWYHCLWRWFYFWATSGADITPTQWGILSKHYTDPEIHTLLPVANTSYIWILNPVDKSVHYLMCQQLDTSWLPPPGGGIYGSFVGNYVWMRIYNGPLGDADLFLFPGLPPTVTNITKVKVIITVGKVYIYGRAQVHMKTHGNNYLGPVVSIGGPGLVEYFMEYSTNPFTGLQWTPGEVDDIEAGVWLEHEGTFGRAICDQVRIEVSHHPA